MEKTQKEMEKDFQGALTEIFITVSTIKTMLWDKGYSDLVISEFLKSAFKSELERM